MLTRYAATPKQELALRNKAPQVADQTHCAGNDSVDDRDVGAGCLNRFEQRGDVGTDIHDLEATGLQDRFQSIRQNRFVHRDKNTSHIDSGRCWHSIPPAGKTGHDGHRGNQLTRVSVRRRFKNGGGFG